MSPKINSVASVTNIPVDEIRDLLSASRSILVASHIEPDGDALGTVLAFGAYLKGIGKNVRMVTDSSIPEKYRFLANSGDIVPASGLPDSEAFDAAVILECPSTARIGSAARLLRDNVVIINIDHHRDNAGFGRVNWVNTRASSVGEMAYEYFMHVDYVPSAEVAEQLYTAILTDTGRFRFSSTSQRTMCIAGELMEAGADPRRICDHVYFNVLPSTMKLTGRVLNTIEFHHDGKFCLLSLTKEMFAECGASESESDGLVDYTLFGRGVLAGALLKEVDITRTKVSLRSSNGIDVSKIASRFGGGGHFNAAGCSIPLIMNEAKGEVMRLFVGAFRDVA